jgi:hypothetical protein
MRPLAHARERAMQHAKQCGSQIALASASASRDRRCVATPAFKCEDRRTRHRCHVTQKAAMCSAETCCHRLAGGGDVARTCQRRRALLVWSDVSLAPLTFTSRLSGCYCSRRRRFRAAECEQRQHDRLGVHSAALQPNGLRSSRPAMTFTLSRGFLSFNLDSAIVLKRQYPEREDC